MFIMYVGKQLPDCIEGLKSIDDFSFLEKDITQSKSYTNLCETILKKDRETGDGSREVWFRKSLLELVADAQDSLERYFPGIEGMLRSLLEHNEQRTKMIAELKRQLKDSESKAEERYSEMEKRKDAVIEKLSDQLKSGNGQEVEEIDALDQSIEKTRTELSDAAMLKSRLEGEINVLKEQINSAQASARHLSGRKETLEREIEEHTKERKKIEAGKEETDRNLSEMEETRAHAAALLASIQARADETDGLIDEGRSRIIEVLNERAAIKTRMGRFDTMLEQVQVRRSEVCQRLLKFKSDESVQDEQLKAEREKLDAVEEDTL